jgi:AraC-like DNA-binding protein
MKARAPGTKQSQAAEREPLAAIVSLLRPQTVLSKLIHGAGKWSVRYERYDDPAFGLVLDGSCCIEASGVGVLELHAGDFLLLPVTPAFTMSSELGLTPQLVTPDSSAEVRHGTKSGPPTLRMLGGYFRFHRANAGLLVKLLPSIIHIRRQEAGAARLRRIVDFIAEEADEQRPGRDLVLERLVEVLLIEALRFQPASAAQREQGLLAGLADPALARSLRGLHLAVARKWTVAELARSAGMSRAVFAERFTRTVGIPPMQYLLEWRMALAQDILRRERPPLAEVAERVGYQSASAFSTAFTRLTGAPPSTLARVVDERAPHAF